MRKASPGSVVTLFLLAQGAPLEATMNDSGYPPPPSTTARAEDFRRLLAGRPAHELPDGWEFVFPGDDEHVAWLVETVQHERGCSQLFQFELSFGRREEAVRFRVRGGTAAKQMVRGWLASAEADIGPGPAIASGDELAGGMNAVPMPE
jgi:hypothetical protein